jgi:Uma2 family endonuclease
MATILPQLPKTKEAQVIPRLSWEQFEQIEKSFESIAGVKFRYLDEALEIMTISPEHEDFKSTINTINYDAVAAFRGALENCHG